MWDRRLIRQPRPKLLPWQVFVTFAAKSFVYFGKEVAAQNSFSSAECFPCRVCLLALLIISITLLAHSRAYMSPIWPIAWLLGRRKSVAWTH